MKNTLVYFDIETSGLDPFQHEITEVGYLVVSGRSREVIHKDAFTVPFMRAAASEEALEVQHFDDRMLAGELPAQITVDDAAKRMYDHFKDATMVVNSLQFDLTFATVFLHRYGNQSRSSTPWSHRSIDLKSMTAGKLGVDLPLLTTGAIMRHFKLENPVAHTALGDAYFNLRWHEALELYRG